MLQVIILYCFVSKVKRVSRSLICLRESISKRISGINRYRICRCAVQGRTRPEHPFTLVKLSDEKAILEAFSNVTWNCMLRLSQYHQSRNQKRHPVGTVRMFYVNN